MSSIYKAARIVTWIAATSLLFTGVIFLLTRVGIYFDALPVLLITGFSVMYMGGFLGLILSILAWKKHAAKELLIYIVLNVLFGPVVLIISLALRASNNFN